MRVRGLWTIGNQRDEKVFYGCYGIGDTSYIATGDGYEGWIDAGKAVETEVDFESCQIVFWKEAPTLGFGTKLADPKQVTTDRSVTLTMDKTKGKQVIQPAEVEFTDPDRVGPVVFMTSMEFNNLVRTVVTALLEKIPKAGGVIASIVGFLWEEQHSDPVKESEERMKRFVQGRFEAADRELLTHTLTGLKNVLEEYHNATGRNNRHQWFNNALAQCEVAQPFFTKTDYTPGTIDMAATVATIHLSLLRERVLFASDIFTDDDVNMDFFKRNLKDTITKYQTFIHDVAVPGELAWRQAQIDDDSTYKEDRYLTDRVTREVHNFRHTGRLIKQGSSQVCVDYYRAQARSAYERQLRENVVHTALFWSWLDPDQEGSHPVALDSVTWTGPLTGLSYRVGNEHDFVFNDCTEVAPGKVTTVHVHAGDLIDGLRFEADGQPGQLVGEAGGTHHAVPVPAGEYLTGIETWFDFDLYAIRLQFSDGTESPAFGNPGRGDVHQSAEFPDHHISRLRIGNRMHELSCGFTPLPDYYERLRQR